MDLVVEGDGPGFARRLAARLGARVRVHERFGTAVLFLPDGRTLDVAAARRERYARNGALPELISSASVEIEEDLRRRDFSIHALALELGRRPRLLDPLGGREDLRCGIVRILHGRSFLDDPTRMLRAVRYAARLRFRLAPATRSRLTEALAEGVLDRISADRLRRELRRLLEEPGRERSIASLERLGLDVAIGVSSRRRRGGSARVGRVSRLAAREAGTTWLCYLLAWMGESSVGEALGVSLRLGLSGAEARRVTSWPATLARLRETAGTMPAARGLSPDERIAAAAVLTSVSRRILRAGTPSVSPLRGADLVAAGVSPGPAIGLALARTQRAIDEGRIRPGAALAFAVRVAREEPA